jgi:hypothetical protein
MARQPGWTSRRRAVFLQALACKGNVTWAARQAGFSRSRLYELRKADPELARQWDEALAESRELLEAEAVRRAVEGTEEPYFYQGEQRGSTRKYSDQLLMFLLKERHAGTGGAEEGEAPGSGGPVVFELHLAGPPPQDSNHALESNAEQGLNQDSNQGNQEVGSKAEKDTK